MKENKIGHLTVKQLRDGNIKTDSFLTSRKYIRLANSNTPGVLSVTVGLRYMSSSDEVKEVINDLISQNVRITTSIINSAITIYVNKYDGNTINRFMSDDLLKSVRDMQMKNKIDISTGNRSHVRPKTPVPETEAEFTYAALP